MSMMRSTYADCRLRRERRGSRTSYSGHGVFAILDDKLTDSTKFGLSENRESARKKADSPASIANASPRGHRRDISTSGRKSRKAGRTFTTCFLRLQQKGGKIDLKNYVGLPDPPKPHDRIIDDPEGCQREEAAGGVAAWNPAYAYVQIYAYA